MRGEFAPLVEFAHELARLIDTHEVAEIVCDAVEGYHPGHDLCLPLTQAAARLRAAGTAMPQHREYRVVGTPRPTGIDEEVVLELDDAALRDKIVRSRRYAARSGVALEQEFQSLFATFGEDAFRFEVLRPAGGRDPQLQAGMPRRRTRNCRFWHERSQCDMESRQNIATAQQASTISCQKLLRQSVLQSSRGPGHDWVT